MLLDHIEQSRFDNNTFTNDAVGGPSYALIAYTTNTTSVSHNTLKDTYQGFHFESADNTGGNGLDVSYNTATGLLAIGIEFNKYASNSRVVGNHLDGWRPGNANGMGLSIVPTGSANAVEYNYVSGAGCSTCNIGIEASGSNSATSNSTPSTASTPTSPWRARPERSSRTKRCPMPACGGPSTATAAIALARSSARTSSMESRGRDTHSDS